MKTLLLTLALGCSLTTLAQKERVAHYEYHWQCQKCGETVGCELKDPNEVKNTRIKQRVESDNDFDLSFQYPNVRPALDGHCTATGNKHIWKKTKGKKTGTSIYTILPNNKVDEDIE